MWFTEKAQEQKCVVRSRERTWKRYEEDHLWKALCAERNKNNHLIETTKREMFSAKIAECKGD